MNRLTPLFLMIPILALIGRAYGADDAAEKIAEQKKTAKNNWESLEAGEMSSLETAHLLIYAPKDYEKKLKEIGATLEAHYAQAKIALGIDKDKDEPVPGKVTVYLLPERAHFTSFLRKIDKHRPEPEDVGSHFADGDFPHVAAGPPVSKDDPPIERQAGEQIAQLLLVKKAGVRTPLPGWLESGFGRATWYRSAPTTRAVSDERKRAAAMLAKSKWAAKDVWSNSLADEEAVLMQASFADFMAYGPGSSKFPAFVVAFKPEENVEKVSMEKALEAVSLKPDVISAGWRKWSAAGP
jgi:hypothetical protein